MKKTVLTLLMGMTFATTVLAQPIPNTKSSTFLLKDIESGKILAAKNSGIKKPIASLTKLMTAMVLLDSRLPGHELLQITDDDIDRYKNSSSRLSVGTLLPRDTMLHLALMSSENRAAHALARTYPGGIRSFVREMNFKAKSLGMSNTHFEDPTGLSEQNVSTADDLAILVEAASKYTKIKQFSTDKEADVHYKKYVNTNPLARGDSWKILLSKTGFTQEAGRCLVMNTVINNKQTAFILLDSPSKDGRTSDALRLKSWLSGEKSSAQKSRKLNKST